MSENVFLDILTVGDSRTRDLENKLDYASLNMSMNLRFTVITLPGANLNLIMLKVLTALSYPNTYQLILIAGGINNMTRLLHVPSRHAVPRFRSVTDLIENTSSAMRVALVKITAITDKPVVLASLPGMTR